MRAQCPEQGRSLESLNVSGSHQPARSSLDAAVFSTVLVVFTAALTNARQMQNKEGFVLNHHRQEEATAEAGWLVVSHLQAGGRSDDAWFSLSFFSSHSEETQSNKTDVTKDLLAGSLRRH